MPLYQFILYFFAGIGLLDTLYLTYHVITKTPVSCPWVHNTSCAKVQNSPQSRLFGFPNAYAGLAIYTAIPVGTWAQAQELVPFWPVTLVVVTGFLFSLYFTYIQMYVLKAFCTWCLISAANFLIMMIAVFILR